MRVVRILPIFAMLVLAACVAAGTVPAVRKLLPAKDDVKGFSILKDSLQYGKGNDISKVYDGGYELYTKAGVIDAVRQMYQRKDDYTEVTIHTMKFEKAALDFLKYWQKENKVAKPTRTKLDTGFTVTKPNAAAYFVTGKYFTTVTGFHAADRAIKDVAAFRSRIGERIRKS